MTPQDDSLSRKFPSTSGLAKAGKPVPQEPPKELSPSEIESLRKVVAEHNRRLVSFDNHWWQVWRQPSVAAATGHIPTPPPAGLVFTSDVGERRFLPMAYPFELPSNEEFLKLSEDELRGLLAKARRQP